MPQNSSHLTQGAQGPLLRDPSTYPRAVNPDDLNADSNSDSSRTQFSQNSTSNTSRQHDRNNHSGNSASRGNSAGNATSGQFYHQSEGAGHSSSRTDRNQNEKPDPRAYVPVRRDWGSPNMDSQPHGGSSSSSNSRADFTLGSQGSQREREGPYHGIGDVLSDPRGSSGGHGSVGGVGQSEWYGRGHGERGSDNRDGDGDSLYVGRGSQSSGRSSGDRN